MAKKVEEELKVVLINNIPAVPNELDINGLKVSDALIKEKVAEAKLIIIKDFDDKVNYKLALEQKQLFVKFRTQSEKWRKAGVAPIQQFLTDIKTKTDGFGAEAKKGEEHLDKEIKKYEDWEETEKKRKAEEKQKRTNDRITLLIAAGGVFDNGSYRFDHDEGLLISKIQIDEYNDKQWDVMYNEVKVSWDDEVQRKADEEAESEKLKNENLLLSASLNEKRTALRYKELKYEGFDLVSPGNYLKNDIHISEQEVLDYDDETWDALISEANSEAEPVEEKPAAVYYGGSPASSPAATSSAPPTIGNDFDDEPAGEPLKDKEVVSVEYVFTKEFPYIEFVLGQFKQRLYVSDFEAEAMEGVNDSNLAAKGKVDENLLFVLVK